MILLCQGVGILMYIIYAKIIQSVMCVILEK